jgi:poly(3-hydroxybutyrate) depolymerase
VHFADLLVYEPCETGAAVAHWRLTGAGHGWPGHASPLPERIMGPDTKVIDAATEVWKFVSPFRRPDAPPLR